MDPQWDIPLFTAKGITHDVVDMAMGIDNCQRFPSLVVYICLKFCFFMSVGTTRIDNETLFSGADHIGVFLEWIECERMDLHELAKMKHAN